MRIALYARVSTLDRGQDVETQLLPMRTYAEGKNATFEIYSDIGVSGSKDRRPELDRLMEDARRGKFEAVLVWKFDRFARSLKHLVTALDEFKSLDIRFISLTEAIDTGTPIGRVLFSIIGAMAQFERDLIQERVLAGLDRVKKQGKILGPPRKIFDHERVRRLHAEGKSLREIAKGMRVGKDTVRKALILDA